MEKQELIYNAGILTEQILFDWDGYTRTWEAFMKSIFSYDGAGNMVLAQSYYFDDPSWILVQKDERTYNGNGNMTMQIYSFWDESSGDWINSSKEELTYNSSGFLVDNISSTWDYFTGDWLKSHKSENIYNGSGPQIEKIFHYTWNEDSSQWINEFKDDFIYDGNMNLVQVIEQKWIGSQWINSYKTELTYNNAYPFNQLIIPWLYVEEWALLINHMPLEMISSEYLGSAYALSDRIRFNFSEINITSINNIESNQVGLYPQPANGYVTFEWQSSNPVSDLDLYGVNGKLVLQKKIEKNKAVAINHLAPGLYFYRITNNQQHSISGKMSVR